MRTISSPVDRRRFLSALSIASLAALAPPEAFAQKLRETAGTTEGPFYPDKLPLDTDNDLLILNDGITPAVGEITHLTGRVFTASGLPVRNAIVEIWQVDADGSYAHTTPIAIVHLSTRNHTGCAIRDRATRNSSINASRTDISISIRGTFAAVPTTHESTGSSSGTGARGSRRPRWRCRCDSSGVGRGATATSAGFPQARSGATGRPPCTLRLCSKATSMSESGLAP
jgi:hypothetical protein